MTFCLHRSWQFLQLLNIFINVIILRWQPVRLDSSSAIISFVRPRMYDSMLYVNSYTRKVQDKALVSSCTGTDLWRSIPESVLRVAINHGNVTINLPMQSQIPISHRALNQNSRHQLIIEISIAQKHVKTKKSLSNLNENFSQKISDFSSLSSISELSTSWNPSKSLSESNSDAIKSSKQRKAGYLWCKCTYLTSWNREAKETSHNSCIMNIN
jgi:hypothetical protein